MSYQGIWKHTRLQLCNLFPWELQIFQHLKHLGVSAGLFSLSLSPSLSLYPLLTPSPPPPPTHTHTHKSICTYKWNLPLLLLSNSKRMTPYSFLSIMYLYTLSRSQKHAVQTLMDEMMHWSVIGSLEWTGCEEKWALFFRWQTSWNAWRMVWGWMSSWEILG